MQHKTRLQISILLIFTVLITACSNQQESTTAHGGPVSDYFSLIDNLRGAGATVDLAGQVSQPFFSPQGQVITVNGQDVQVFEYVDVEAARAEAELVSPDGSSVGTSMMMWVDTPHFYQSGKVIVLYLGAEIDVINILDRVLGSQFAGG